MLDSSALNNSPNHRRKNNLWLSVASAAAVFVCLFGHLGAMGLVGPDEPRYAWIARAMAQTGDWVTPRLYGQPWFEKPILYYWAAAIGFRLHLPAEWAARLPSAFAALAAALTIGWLAWKFYGATAPLAWNPAILAPLIFSTSVAAIGFSRAATPDMLFSACIALSMASVACILDANGALRASASNAHDSPSSPAPPRKPARRGEMPFRALRSDLSRPRGTRKRPRRNHPRRRRNRFMGAGNKTVAGSVSRSSPSRDCGLLHRSSALVHFVRPAQSGFHPIFIFQHNFERYLTPLFQHPQPFWFFIPITLLAILPWTVLLWPSTREVNRIWREKPLSDSPAFFFACWAIFPVLFFSLSQSKLPSYILPSVPPLALLVAVALADLFRTPKPTKPAPESANRKSFVTIGIFLGLTWKFSASCHCSALGDSLRRRATLVPRNFYGSVHCIVAGIAVAFLALLRKNVISS